MYANKDVYIRLASRSGVEKGTVLYRARGHAACFFTLLPIWERSIVMSVSVCLCPTAIISPELHVQCSSNFSCALPMAVVRSTLAAK